MKPHEETWTTDPLDSREVVAVDGSAAFRVAEAYMGTRAGDGSARKDTARLIAAAPAMARALLALGEPTMADDLPCWCFMQASDGTHRKQCDRVRAVLKEAGVLE